MECVLNVFVERMAMVGNEAESVETEFMGLVGNKGVLLFPVVALVMVGEFLVLVMLASLVLVTVLLK